MDDDKTRAQKIELMRTRFETFRAAERDKKPEQQAEHDRNQTRQEHTPEMRRLRREHRPRLKR